MLIAVEGLTNPGGDPQSSSLVSKYGLHLEKAVAACTRHTSSMNLHPLNRF